MNSLYEACEWAINVYATGATENKKGEPSYFDFAACVQSLGHDVEEVVAVCERAVDESRETSVNLINTPVSARQAMWAVAVLVGSLEAA